MDLYLLALSIAPAIVIILFIYLKDKYNREPLRHLIICFLLGAMCSLPAVYIEVYVGNFLSRNIQVGFLHTIITGFVIIGFTEEYCKYFMLRRYAYDKKDFDEPFDGIVYSVMVAMGFATIENVGYVYQHGVSTGVMRMFLSVPAHASFAVMMGYYVGMAKFKPALAYVLRTVGIVWAVVLHGAYDTFLLLGQNGVISAYVSRGLLISGAFFSYFIGIRFSLSAIKKHRLLSKELYEQKLTIL